MRAEIKLPYLYSACDVCELKVCTTPNGNEWDFIGRVGIPMQIEITAGLLREWEGMGINYFGGIFDVR